jgi:uncharacterized protein (DUF433 family)
MQGDPEPAILEVRRGGVNPLYLEQSESGVEMPLPKPLITRSDAVMSGAVVFAGTRVPVQTLLDYLEEGGTLDHFLEDFPTVTREHAVAVKASSTFS